MEKDASPPLYPNTVPSVSSRQRDVINGNQLDNSLESKPNGLHHLSAYPTGRRRPENVLYNKNRDLNIKPSPYGLSGTNGMQLFPYGDRDQNRTTANNGGTWMYEMDGKQLEVTKESLINFFPLYHST